MYLTQAIVNTDGREHQMVGLFPTRVRMHRQLAAISYVEAEVPQDVLWPRAGQRLRGHEFHYSTIDEMPPSVRRCLRLCANGKSREDGYAIGSVLAGYAHLHFRSLPNFASGFVHACLLYRDGMQLEKGAEA
jgi:cobyrinic acid a,c-diamide synthase